MRRVVFALAIVLVAAGCGSGGRLSKGEYAKRADAICRKYNSKLRALGQPKSVKALPGYVDRALPLARRGNDELRSLKPPKDEEKTAKEWVDQNNAVVAALERLRDAAEKNDGPAIQLALSEATAANRAANGFAHRLALTDCARG